MELLQRIQRWYTINCNGDWEHSYGVSITALDNPGWAVKINLQDTCLQNAVLNCPLVERSATDWTSYSVKNGAFDAFGGPENLTEILRFFLNTFLPENIDPECTVEVYLPVRGYEGFLWLKAQGKMISESILEIVSIADPGLSDSIEWRSDSELDLLTQLKSTFSELQTDYTVGDVAEPYVFQAGDNMLRTFLVAAVKQ